MMISLSWIIWFVAVFAFPITTNSTASGSSLDSVSNAVHLTKIHFNSTAELLEIPEFKVDWSLDTKLNSYFNFELLSPYKAYLSPSFFKKSAPLFDIKDTFIYFFYTW